MIALLNGSFQVNVIKDRPILIIVRTGREKNPPVAHDALRVMGDQLLEAFACLFVIERIGPYKTTIKPILHTKTLSRDFPSIGTKVNIVLL